MNTNTIYNESCLDTLSKMPDSYIDCVITSPPYWQLRDYGYPEQWGLEPTFQEYLEHLWEMMDIIHRVLKPQGTVWINLGDTYGTKSGGMASAQDNFESKEKKYGAYDIPITQPKTIHKCLLLIPHRFAIGCIDRGWIVRNDIIWAKRNGMPESVTDRFTKKHEYIFFMTKQEKYFFDLDSIRDKLSEVSIKRYDYGWNGNGDRDYINGPQNNMTRYLGDAEKKKQAIERGKNPGSVSDFWDVTTKGTTAEHYAAYNDELIKKPILAGCPEGGIIYDPFMGTGSTAEAALRANRKFIGSEMSSKYCDIANKRLKPYLQQQNLFE